MKAKGFNSSSQEAILSVYLYDAADRISKWGKEAINAFAEGDEQRGLLLGIKRFSKHAPLNTKELRQRIAKELIEANTYCY